MSAEEPEGWRPWNSSQIGLAQVGAANCYRGNSTLLFVHPYCLIAGGEKDDRTAFVLTRHEKNDLLLN